MTIASPLAGCVPPCKISVMRPFSTMTVESSAGVGLTQSISLAWVRIVRMAFVDAPLINLRARFLHDFRPLRGVGLQKSRKLLGSTRDNLRAEARHAFAYFGQS